MVRVDSKWYTWSEGDPKYGVFLTTQSGRDVEFDFKQIDDIQEGVEKLTKSKLKEIVKEVIQTTATNKSIRKKIDSGEWQAIGHSKKKGKSVLHMKDKNSGKRFDLKVNESINEGSAYKTATNNELAMYLTQLSTTINGTKDKKMLKLLKRTKKEVDDELKSRKSINEAGMFDDYHELNPAYMDKFIKSYKKLNNKNVVKKKGDYTYGFRKGEREAHWKFDNDDYKLHYDIAKVKALGLINNFNRFKKDHPWG